VNDTQPPSNSQPPKIYLVGSINQDHSWLNCCPTATTLPATEKSTGLPAVIAIPCRRWGCKWCGQRKAFTLACRVERATPTKFITVTSDAKLWTDPRECYDFTRRKVADFAKRIRQKVGSFEYLRVLETHKNGLPHYHFVARCPYIPQKWLSTAWAELTGSIIVHIKAVDKQTNVFRYILKYLCKQEYISWTNRRVSWSHDFFPKPAETPPRDNPYITRTRHHSHPCDFITFNYQRQKYVERRPGVWVIYVTSEIDHATWNQSLQPPPEKCQQKNLPSIDSMKSAPSS